MVYNIEKTEKGRNLTTRGDVFVASHLTAPPSPPCPVLKHRSPACRLAYTRAAPHHVCARVNVRSYVCTLRLCTCVYTCTCVLFHIIIGFVPLHTTTRRRLITYYYYFRWPPSEFTPSPSCPLATPHPPTDNRVNLTSQTPGVCVYCVYCYYCVLLSATAAGQDRLWPITAGPVRLTAHARPRPTPVFNHRTQCVYKYVLILTY